MDSRLAADPIARHILDQLTTLEKAAGVRAHYRILDSPPLVSLDPSSINTVARVLSDWIGLRNAIFDINIVEGDKPPRLVRINPDQEEFAMELPASVLTSTDCALSVISRQVARAYLMTSNIAGGSVDPNRSAGSMADVAAVFLGMGKLLLNAPATGNPDTHAKASLSPENRPLSAEYLAFTHRIVCSMRGLDWNQHTNGLAQSGIALLRQWDGYRDTVFSQALRNVLTASASHRPLMDAVEDNHLALARFDQMQRAFEAVVLHPLHSEVKEYHQTCREGMERLTAREQDTYDPCLLYLNQLRRRMDLQRYADMLLKQQDHIVNRLRVLTAAMGDLNARKLIYVNSTDLLMNLTHCPFDGTKITLHDEHQDSRVRCPNCGYTFLASNGLPQISALKPQPLPPAPAEDDQVEEEASSKNKPAKATTASRKKTAVSESGAPPQKSRKAATLIITGIILMPLAWLPMLIYFSIQLLKRQEAPLIGQLGQIGIIGSTIAMIILVIGFILAISNWMRRRKSPAQELAAEGS